MSGRTLETSCKSVFLESPTPDMIPLTDTRPVHVTVDLPEELAADVEDVTEQDPEFLGRVIQYALARRIIFDELASTTLEAR